MTEAQVLMPLNYARPPWGGEDCSHMLPAVLFLFSRSGSGGHFASFHEESVVAEVAL
jgi:hypothetical protein